MKEKDLPNDFKKQKLIDKTFKNEISLEDIVKDKIVALLFSAKWCPVDEEFLREVKKFYQEVKFDKNQNFEIVYVSFDDNEATSTDHFLNLHGNWLLWPFKSELKK